MEFKDRLIELRKEKGMSQEKLANVLGLTHQALSKYELGLSEPDIATLKRMAAVFDVTIDYLVGKSPRRKEKASSPLEFFKFLPKKRYAYLLLSFLMLIVLSLYSLPATGTSISLSTINVNVNLETAQTFFGLLEGSEWYSTNSLYCSGVALNIVAVVLVSALFLLGFAGFLYPFRKRKFFFWMVAPSLVACVFAITGSVLWWIGFFRHIESLPTFFFGHIYAGILIAPIGILVSSLAFSILYAVLEREERSGMKAVK